MTFYISTEDTTYCAAQLYPLVITKTLESPHEYCRVENKLGPFVSLLSLYSPHRQIHSVAAFRTSPDPHLPLSLVGLFVDSSSELILQRVKVRYRTFGTWIMANDPSNNTFTFRPLGSGHIRLLSFSKRRGERIYQLSHVDLASAPEYFTLSYTWGDPPDRDQDILVNGTMLKVTKILTIALPYPFEKYQSQRFWIDGICTDQGDREKEYTQVPLMGKIYTQTTTCVIWLWESNSLIGQAIPSLLDLLKKFQRCNPSLGSDERRFRAHGIPVPSSPIWAGLEDLMLKDWFTRVWTFQDAVLPETLEILCGRHFIPTTSLARLTNIMLSMPESGLLKSMSDAFDERKDGIRAGIFRIATVRATRY
jgi:hypothetical protein